MFTKLEERSKVRKAEIKAIIRTNHGASTRIAELLGVGQSAISMWVNGRSPSKRMETEIPKAIAKLRLTVKKRRAA